MAVVAFLSYSHKDKQLAGNIKKELEKYGFDCFLAHEDIEPSADWEREILRQLQNCEVFIAILSDDFDESDWTHQEIGIAYARRPIMVPINAGTNPVGFLARYQATRVDRNNVKPACSRIVASVAGKSDRIAQEMRQFLIKRIGEASTFDSAGYRARRLEAVDDLKPMSPDQANALLKAATTNPQVYRSGRASGPLHEIIRRHRKDIRRGILTNFRKVWVYR